MTDGKTRRYMNEREWLCFEDGVKYERERVIKLLEEAEAQALKGIDSAFTASAQTKFVWQADTYNKAIALIKGEK